ncbi:MAG: dTDP-4-dehydrorhamnose 3,5-epimerase [Cyanobacteria bacterium 13_1_40CM_2_61_4]|nr:MAG: dTDP-4-dehydrorhamnose 3,5-epimerase [Cyanobacteria bacterium 13_1_40CM_2_61_4]
MIFTQTLVEGAFVIAPAWLEDERGLFGRSFCQQEFQEHGLNPRVAQCNISLTHKRGTLRGMHYQAAPYEEAKLVRCTRGAIYDVIVDVRPGSPTFKRWVAVELTAENRKMSFVPEGTAHGFQTLEDHTEVLYQMSEFYHPEAARGVRWDDPAFGIEWPVHRKLMADRDKRYPDFTW